MLTCIEQICDSKQYISQGRLQVNSVTPGQQRHKSGATPGQQLITRFILMAETVVGLRRKYVTMTEKFS